ncbi:MULTISPECIES: BID domain-containing T4SS effector [Bartonella]|uniref:BID domain-containing T4SS effector n=1 Tax=Bartonella TaxID=773 RepID=UPI00236209D4|nr:MULTISPECIES: BID domain-containing T4SS effector [Bartonella]
MKKSHPHPETQSQEPLYARVNKQNRREGPRIPSPEEIQQANASASNTRQFPSDYDTPPQRPLETVYAPQTTETIYAPQKPLGNPYDRLGGNPSNGRRAEKLADPYAIVDLATGETEFEQRINPLYDSPSGSTQDLRYPQRPEEHLYAEINHGANGGLSPQKPIESVYATVGMGAEGGQESQQRENPLYEGVGRGTTPPPRTPKDEITTKLLKNVDFQYGVRETQEWCKVVYGNEHALNGPLAKILENPQDTEKILWDLAENPESPGKLAGRQLLGVKSPDRKEAEDGFRHLYSALEKHIHTTQKLHKEFTREQERGLKQESPERDTEHKHHHHHRHHHARGQEQNSPEHSPHQRRQEGNRGMAFAM